MTIIEHTRPQAEAPAALERLWNVVRLHLTNKWNTLALPWLILGFIFLVNYAIWLIVYNASDQEGRSGMSEGTAFSGAAFYFFVYASVIAVQAITLTFSFALSYSATRRDYYLGTVLTFGILAAIYACGMTILSYVEDLTGGWGVGGHMFSTVYYGHGDWWARLFAFFVLFFFFFVMGAAAATFYVRWRMNGMLAWGAIMALILIGGAALIAFTNSWGAVWEWLVATGPVGIIAWLLVPIAVAATAGFFILRRATPKS